MHYTNSQTNRHMPPQDIVESCEGGEGGTKQSDCSIKLWGGVRNMSVLLQNWEGGTKHISVLLENRGVRNVSGFGKNRGYETFLQVIFRGTKHLNIS